MLERDRVLRTWSLEVEPQPNREIGAELLTDHRIEYLDYEGAVSGNRGFVSQWDAGTYETLLANLDELSVRLWGRILNGEVSLRRSAEDVQRWTFIFSSRDEGTR